MNGCIWQLYVKLMPKVSRAESNPTLVVQRCCKDGLGTSLDLQSLKSTAGFKSFNSLNYNWHKGKENILLFYEKAGFIVTHHQCQAVFAF